MNNGITAVNFTNWTKEDFAHTWDGVLYNFQAGSTMILEDWKAVHFAKHLINRELLKLEKRTDDRVLTEEMLAKTIQSQEDSEPKSQDEVNTEILNANAKLKALKVAELKELAEKQGLDVTGKKKDEIIEAIEAAPTEETTPEEEEFEGLNAE